MCELAERDDDWRRLAVAQSKMARRQGEAVSPVPVEEVAPIVCDYLAGYDPDATGCLCLSVSTCLLGRTNRLGGPAIERADCLACPARSDPLEPLPCPTPARDPA